jgi:dihydroorotase
MTRITIIQPDDWHVHLRDGAMMQAVLPYTAAQFGRAIIMPNLVPPVTTSALAAAYRERILAARPEGSNFEPLMVCYLTNTTDPDDIERGYREGIWVAAKLYPSGATTNSHHGVTDINAIHAVLARMEKIGMKLLIHGESTDPSVDMFDREAVFLEQILPPILKAHPGLKVVMEHITTAEAADFVRANAPRMAATITPHHLIINRTTIFQGGIRPHLYCLPIAKRERHRLALRKAATSGEACFFLGTDTAPHMAKLKEAACGCAGCFVAPTALQSYVRVFDEEGALGNFEAFASLNGPAFYDLPVNASSITLERSPGRAPECMAVENESVVVFEGGETAWSLL